MRALVISSYFGPETSVGVLRVNAFVKYWARAGLEIDVITMPYSGSLPPGLEGNDKVRVFAVAPYLIGGKQSGDSQGYAKGATGLKKRIVNFQYWLKRKFLSNYLDPRILWWPRVARFVKQRLLAESRPYDFIYSTVPSYTAHSAAAAVKAASPKSLWLADYRDLWSGNPIFPGCSLVRRFERWHERFVLKKADLIVSINVPLIGELRAIHGGDRYLVIPNGFDDSEVDQSVAPLNSPVHSGEPEEKPRILLVYAGSILPGLQDPSPLLLAIKELADEGEIEQGDLELRFYGDYAALDRFPIAQDPALAKFIGKCGKVSRSSILEIQRQADFLLFLGSKPVVDGVGSTTGVVSGKLFEYLISGTEILAVRVTDDMIAAELLVRSRTGNYYGDDVDKIKQRLRQALQAGGVPKVVPDMRYLDQFRRSKQAQALLEAISRHIRRVSLPT